MGELAVRSIFVYPRSVSVRDQGSGARGVKGGVGCGIRSHSLRWDMRDREGADVPATRGRDADVCLTERSTVVDLRSPEDAVRETNDVPVSMKTNSTLVPLGLEMSRHREEHPVIAFEVPHTLGQRIEDLLGTRPQDISL